MVKMQLFQAIQLTYLLRKSSNFVVPDIDTSKLRVLKNYWDFQFFDIWKSQVQIKDRSYIFSQSSTWTMVLHILVFNLLA